jgi:Asp-tRNA(Asn)/Glu-tRNA(Gln) amidotransferase A subunit family amidase
MHWEPIGTLAARVRAGELDPAELAERAIARARSAADLNAVVHLDENAARHAPTDGPLAGIPVLVKEIIAVQGWPFTCGSAVFAGRIADRDAEIVRRLRAAGAVLIGLTHSHEFAYGCTGTSNVNGPCRNPHDPTRITGGSSSGSAAAVAAGIVPLALGTDTAGSVRIPAALCGAVGALPARGTLPADGVFPLSRTLDRVGVLAASVADAHYAVNALSGHAIIPAEPSRLGVLSTDAPEAFRSTLDALTGVTFTEVDWPQWTDLAQAAFDIQGPEAAAIHADRTRDGYQPDVVERLRVAAEVPGWRYVKAREQSARLATELGALLSTMDALIMPTSPITAPPIDADEVDGQSVRDLLLQNNRPLNATPYPALSVPIPTAGLPLGIQVIAADNHKAFGVAQWLERTLSRGQMQ